MDAPFLYVCRMDEYTDAMYEKHFASLPVWRREKVEKIKNREKQKQSTLAFMLLRYALKNTLHTEDFTFSYNSYGKPYIAECGMFFSISHCSKAVAVGVSASEIGVDAECILETPRRAGERVFSDAEQKNIAKEAEPGTAFTRLWTEKEAYAKFCGRGILSLNGFEEKVRFSYWQFPDFYVTACTKNETVALCEIMPDKI